MGKWVKTIFAATNPNPRGIMVAAIHATPRRFKPPPWRYTATMFPAITKPVPRIFSLVACSLKTESHPRAPPRALTEKEWKSTKPQDICGQKIGLPQQYHRGQ